MICQPWNIVANTRVSFCNRYQEHKSLVLVRSTWAGVVTTCLRLLKYLISVRNAYGIQISLDFVCSKRIGEQVNHAVLYAKFTQRLQNWNRCSWQSIFPEIWVKHESRREEISYNTTAPKHFVLAAAHTDLYKWDETVNNAVIPATYLSWYRFRTIKNVKLIHNCDSRIILIISRH